MKLLPIIPVVLSTLLFSNTTLAGVYRCTDHQGNTAYQSAPCAAENIAIEMNLNTGGGVDLTDQEKQKQTKEMIEAKAKKEQLAEIQQKIELAEKWKKQAIQQSAINQQLIRNNPVQFSAFAIPPYEPDKLSSLVKPYKTRLIEIEKFRRLAALKALATSECLRVEANALDVQSKLSQLVFSVDCSSGKRFYFNESELTK